MAVGLMICFSRSGGTVLNKCLAVMPDTIVISEVNPVGGGWGREQKESYTTVQSQAKHWHGIELENTDYGQTVAELEQILKQRNQHLVVRDWSYINFYPKEENNFEPKNDFLALTEISSQTSCKPFVFLRDAIDVWISNGKRDPDIFFLHYQKYLETIKSYNIPVFKFEDFCRTPKKELQKICNYLEIPYDESFTTKFSEFKKVNGDTQIKKGSRGGKSKTIRPISRKIIEPSHIQIIESNKFFRECNEMFDYSASYYNSAMQTSQFQLTKRKIEFKLERLFSKKK